MVAAISQFLIAHKGGVLHSDDHLDSSRDLFLSRLEWDLDGFDLPIVEFEQYFIVLARYMQILGPEFVAQYLLRTIHHSFLPAFVRATSHYVTAGLDDGPIIEQDVVCVSHRDSVGDMLYKGSDLEKVVLSRSVRWHLENRILVYQNKTVVFV